MALNQNNSPEYNKNTPNIQEHTKNLLGNLAQQISTEYGIDETQVREFINSKTGDELSTLKSLINHNTGKEIDLSELKSSIDNARATIETSSKQEIQALKWALNTSPLTPRDEFFVTQKIIPHSFLQRAQNPKKISDNIIWGALWVLNSLEASGQFVYSLATGIVKTPYDLYLIASGKWEYKNTKSI